MKESYTIEPFAQQLHQAKRQGKTQKEIAKLMGIPFQTITNVKGKRTAPSLDFILKACNVFDCEIQDIVQRVKDVK